MLVIKNNGTTEPFTDGKLNRWASYAAKEGGDWGTVARETMARLPSRVTSAEIHQTMINVCLDKENIKFSRIAARLEIATIRKNISRLFGGGVNIKDFRGMFNLYESLGLWKIEKMGIKYDPRWEKLYEEIYHTRLEYWQIKQWMDKYTLKYNDVCIETPHLGVVGLAIAIHGDSYDKVRRLVLGVINGKINLPTPVNNGCRNGDFDSISCCVISGGDSVDSIGVAEHIAYRMTAKKAGIGIEFTTRSAGAPVKGGRVKHLGKHGIYQTVDRAVKMFTQVGRGGSATMTYTCIDPEIELLLQLKTQRIPENQRIDKMDYSFAYTDAFIEAVIGNEIWYLFDYHKHPKAYELLYNPETKYSDMRELAYKVELEDKYLVQARDVLKMFLQARQETGRIYCINLSRANSHTPFTDTIRLSNLCQEICLPTKPYTGMHDLYAKQESVGETAFCSLAAINVSKVTLEEYEDLADITLETVDRLISKAPMLTESMLNDITRRRSVGIGITGLHGLFIREGVEYGSKESLAIAARYAEHHYYFLLKASQRLAKELGACDMSRLKKDWLPIDTAKVAEYEPTLDWEALRGKSRRNSVLVAHMPTESSAVFSDATNGLYPVREKVISKASRHGKVQYIAPAGDYKLAWDLDNNDIANVYAAIQDFTDQAISADYYVDFSKYANGKVGLGQLMKEFVYQARKGVKTMYYVNTNDENGGAVQQAASDCSSCKL